MVSFLDKDGFRMNFLASEAETIGSLNFIGKVIIKYQALTAISCVTSLVFLILKKILCPQL